MATVSTVKATWTADYKGTDTTFRLVQRSVTTTAASGTSTSIAYVIETLSVDSTGKNAWTEFLLLESDTSDRTATKLTVQAWYGLLDVIYT